MLSQSRIIQLLILILLIILIYNYYCNSYNSINLNLDDISLSCDSNIEVLVGGKKY